MPHNLSLTQQAEAACADNPEERIKSLAALSTIEYERQRTEAACELGVRVEVLDSEVKKLRGDTVNTKGSLIEYLPIEPWPDSVNGAELLDSLAERISRHMAMPEWGCHIAALWAVHAHCFEVFTHSPRLVITAPEKECGKTVLLGHLLGNLVPKAQAADSLTAPVFFRLVQLHKPTFLIDEVDAWLKEDSLLPAALNGGFERLGNVMRCEGDSHEVRGFSTFAPTAMAGINLVDKLPAPTVSRSFVIDLQRSLPGEVVENYDQRKHQNSLHTLRRKIARWVQDNLGEIRDIDPVLPESVRNRQLHKWAPLAAIAEVAGGKWPGHVNAALFADSATPSFSKSEQLLTDISTVINQSQDQVGIFTDDLIKGLCRIEDSPWEAYNFKEWENKNIKPRQIALLLKPYKVKPKTIRQSGLVRKGYRFDELQTVIDRYLTPLSPPHPPLTSVTPLQVNDTNAYRGTLSVTSQPNVTDRNQLQPNDSNGCNGVTHKKGGSPRGGRRKPRYLWEAAILCWLNSIGEDDPDEIDSVLKQCCDSVAARTGFLRQAQSVTDQIVWSI